MKGLGILLMVASILLCAGALIHGGIYASYSYDVRMGQYIRLADDSSTAESKLEYLKKFEEVVSSNIFRNEARYVFKKERLTRDKQLKVLSTLQTRLQDAVEMDPLSFEYQTAMQQITGQEFDHALGEINDIISSCWLRQSGFAVFCLWIAWLLCLILFIIGLVIWENSR